jgi:hypothetical protein
MRWSRFALWTLVATLGIGGVALVADAIVESDEERIAEVADALTGASSDRRIDAVLAWVDPTRVEVAIRADGSTERFGEEDGDPGDAIRAALAPFASERIELVQRSIAVAGDEAELAVRVRADGEVVDATIDLRRDGQAWLVREVRRLD